MSMSEDERESRIDSILKRAEKLAYDLQFVKDKEDKATWFRLSAELMEILSGLRLWQLKECSDELIIKLLEHIEKSMEQAPPVSPPPFLDSGAYVVGTPVESLEQQRREILEGLDISGLGISREERADADLKNAITDLVKEETKDMKDRRAREKQLRNRQLAEEFRRRWYRKSP